MMIIVNIFDLVLKDFQWANWDYRAVKKNLNKTYKELKDYLSVPIFFPYQYQLQFSMYVICIKSRNSRFYKINNSNS